ncbi:tetratricopeptide repeat protein [Parasphingopyxis sp.]|uniref:tetratricopeptide repeat protein n=1 Tax=Parasphingopyxis sp. TaxID=1920299 RepID=UPI003FA028A4
MVKKLTGLAFAGAVAMAVPMAAPVAAQEALAYDLTQDVRSAAEQAQTAIAQGNFPSASAYLNQAAAAARTDGDRYVVASLQLDVANRTFNTAAQVAAINALLSSPFVSAEQSAELYYHRARISYHAQNGDAARADLQAAIDRGTSNPRIFIAMASLMDDRGDHAAALSLVERAFEIHRTAGIAIPAEWYRRAIHFAQELGDNQRVLALGQMLVAEHPDRRNWRDVLIQHRSAYSADPDAALDLWRLQDAAGALTGEFDYRDYARVAHGRSLPAEIERIVQAGRTANILDGGNAEIATLDRGTTRAAQALRSALPGRAGSAASAATGEAAMAAADGYMSLGDYAAAAPLYRMAAEKGGVDVELANLRLGMALARAGDAAGARAAFDQVTGVRASIARLWAGYAALPQPAPQPAPALAAQPETPGT